MRLNIHEMKQAAQLVMDWHCYFLGWISMRLNIHEMKQAAQVVLDWHCYLLLEFINPDLTFMQEYIICRLRKFNKLS